jgi:hypothetical protein
LNQPNPWILVMGGIALINVSFVVSGLHAPAWVRYGGMAICAIAGLTSIGLGLARQFQKKPPRTKYVPKRKRTSKP